MNGLHTTSTGLVQKLSGVPTRKRLLPNSRSTRPKNWGMLSFSPRRIIQLGGTPVTKPEDWYKHTNCGYDAPDDPFIVKVLEQNIKGEQCAIKSYNSLLKKTRDKDPVTYNMVLGILQMEVEHEEDLQALLEDVNIIMKNK